MPGASAPMTASGPCSNRGDGTWRSYGAFQSFNGSPRQCIANLTANGTLNSQYDSFTIANTGTSTGYAIQDSPQGLYIGGDFSGYGGKYTRPNGPG